MDWNTYGRAYKKTNGGPYWITYKRETVEETIRFKIIRTDGAIVTGDFPRERTGDHAGGHTGDNGRPTFQAQLSQFTSKHQL
eukprot:3811991-Pyramimonas_sp.AAC.1